jgi:hypothetical protein
MPSVVLVGELLPCTYRGILSTPMVGIRQVWPRVEAVEARVTDVVDLDDELEVLVEAPGVSDDRHGLPPHIERMNRRWPRIVVVHTPVHASWLNQVEVYFSIVQRKVRSLAHLEDRLLGFQEHYGAIARPFEWKFTRRDLKGLLSKLAAPVLHRLARAA